MARLTGSVDTKPRKQKVGLHKDGYHYTRYDSGCPDATLFLGQQSLCLECPFPECILDKDKKSGPKKK